MPNNTTCFVIVAGGGTVFGLAMSTLLLMGQRELKAKGMSIYLIFTLLLINLPLAFGRLLFHTNNFLPDETTNLGRTLSENFVLVSLVSPVIVAAFMSTYKATERRSRQEFWQYLLILPLIPIVLSGAIWGWLIYLQ